MKKTLLAILCLNVNFSFGQMEQFQAIIEPQVLSFDTNGFAYFNMPNLQPPGNNFHLYKLLANDNFNDMELIGSHVDELIHYRHDKYQQTYKNIPVEGAGMIEHFDSNGNLEFMNAKLAVGMYQSKNPGIKKSKIIEQLLPKLSPKLKFAWNDPAYEADIKIQTGSPNASWYPTPELIFALDRYKDLGFKIDSSRYKLAYKISITTVEPLATNIYFVDANTAEILKVVSTESHNITADVYGYGNRTLDSDYFGGLFGGSNILHTTENGREITTKKYDGNTIWHDNDEVERPDQDENWGSVYLTETSAHFHVTNTWDYFKSVYNRAGMDGNGTEIRVHTQWWTLNENNPTDNAAFDNNDEGALNLKFGSRNGWDYGMEPSIVAHEFTHGITATSAHLYQSYESGALDESFSDIFGIVVPALTLDGGATDWIYGNFVPGLNHRSFSDPNSRGTHFNDQGVLLQGQPDTYGGLYWSTNTYDNGGRHGNSGVQNHWFYMLANGASGTNDNGQSYDVTGIGLQRASKIAYLTLTTTLQAGAQFIDSRSATIEMAKLLYGECSLEHKSTEDAWYGVGLGAASNCAPVGNVELNNVESEILIYPNPANNFITVEVPSPATKKIQILDVTGKLLHEINTENYLSNFALDNYSNGLYTVLIQANGITICRKFVVQK